MQSFLNAGFSLLQLAYMLIYIPYKDTFIMFSSTLGEICTTTVTIISIIFVYQPSEQMQANLSGVIVIFILSSIIGQTCISLIMGIKSIINIWKKIQYWNAKEFLRSAVKIYHAPIGDNTNYPTNPTSPSLFVRVDHTVKQNPEKSPLEEEEYS